MSTRLGVLFYFNNSRARNNGGESGETGGKYKENALEIQSIVNVTRMFFSKAMRQPQVQS